MYDSPQNNEAMKYILIFGSGLEALTAILTIKCSHKCTYENFLQHKRQELKYSFR